MISIEKLKAVTHIVTHANCPDGTASALILKDALPSARVSFMKYNTQELDELPAEPGMIFCDFSPPKARIPEFIEAGAVVLDHHSRELVEPFGELGVFGENEKLECGAMLAYREVWVPIVKEGAFDGKKLKGKNVDRLIKDFATMAAVRDTWQTKHSLWLPAWQQAEALLFLPFDSLTLGDFGENEGAMELGAILVEKALAAARASVGEARYMTVEKLRLAIFQGVSTTSDAAELLGDEADIVVGFHYRQDGDTLKLQFSTRSHTGFDCQALARAHGGNGHKPAAGFSLDLPESSLDYSLSPYAVFTDLFEAYIATKKECPLKVGDRVEYTPAKKPWQGTVKRIEEGGVFYLHDYSDGDIESEKIRWSWSPSVFRIVSP